MNDSVLASGCKGEPYWWIAAPRPQLAAGAVPSSCDVAVVGSGYTGLAAAIELARNGRAVVVLDAEDAGWGCSTRNGGQVSTSIKPSYAQLRARHGKETAWRIRREGINALEWIEQFVAREQIDCDYTRCGRFHAAHSPSAFDALVREARSQPPRLDVDAQVVPRSAQNTEVGSDLYYGGLLYPKHAALHPGKFHAGLLRKALESGVTVMPRCAVAAIASERGGFHLRSARGSLRAREVIVASNGYTGKVTPWLRRRIIPIGSYIIATEPLPAGLARRLIPRNRVVSDTRKVVFYYRLSEDGQRMLFGGRVAGSETDPMVSGPRLHRQMTRLFPELGGVKVSHSWVGFVAYTFDALPHLGRQADGIYYCMGYCGSGVSLGPYFGTRLAQQLLGKAEGQTALDGLRFQTRPFYSGNPWLLPAVIAYYRLRDRLG